MRAMEGIWPSPALSTSFNVAVGISRSLIIGRPDQRGSTGRDNRMFVEGVLWIVRTGSPWRDLPEAFGEWNSAEQLAG